MSEHVDNSGPNHSLASRARATETVAVTAAELAAAFESRSLSPADMNLLLAHPEAKVLATAAVLRSLAATKYYFDRATNQMVYTPDYATQLAAAKLIFERTEGLPVQMNLNVNATAQAQKNLATEEMLEKSPAMQEALARALARVKAKRAGTKT